MGKQLKVFALSRLNERKQEVVSSERVTVSWLESRDASSAEEPKGKWQGRGASVEEDF